MIPNRFQSLLTLALAMGLATATPALDVPLKRVELSKSTAGFMPEGYGIAHRLPEKPAALKIPKLNFPKPASNDIDLTPSGMVAIRQPDGPRPAYGELTLAGKKIHFVLDGQKPGDIFYTRLYLDINGNNDLTDDKPFEVASTGQGMAKFDGIEMKIPADGGEVPFRFSLECNAMVISSSIFPEDVVTNQLTLRITVNDAYLGQFTLDGKAWRVMLGDMNGNGTYDDFHSSKEPGSVTATTGGKQIVYQEGDAFLLSDKPDFDVDDVMVLGNLLVLNDTTYRVSVNIGAGKLTLTPVAEGLVPLTIPPRTDRLEMITPDKKVSVVMIDPAATVKVPAVDYRLFKYMIHKQDAQGDTWRAVAQADGTTVSLGVDGKSALKIGEPFQARVELPYRNDEPGLKKTLSLAVTDQAGMRLRGVTHVAGDKTRIPLTSDRTRPTEPSYKILTGTGDQAAAGQFEYG